MFPCFTSSALIKNTLDNTKRLSYTQQCKVVFRTVHFSHLCNPLTWLFQSIQLSQPFGTALLADKHKAVPVLVDKQSLLPTPGGATSTQRIPSPIGRSLRNSNPSLFT